MKDNNSNKNSNKIVAWLKERVRKFFVALKKNPQAIPLVALCITFVQYSMNLTSISDTTAKIQGANMGTPPPPPLPSQPGAGKEG